MKKVFEPISFIKYQKLIEIRLFKIISKEIEKFYRTLRLWEKYFFSRLIYLDILLLLLLGTLFFILFLVIKQKTIHPLLIVGCVLNGIAFVTFFFNFWFRNFKLNQLFRKIEQADVYRIAFTELSGVDFTAQESVYDHNSFRYRINEIPWDAKMTSSTTLIKFKVFNKYLAKTQIANFLWVRKYGRHAVVYRRATGFIEITLPEVPTLAFNFTVKDPIISKKSKTLNLENSAFNKLKIRSDFPVKSRIIFTPLSMELILNHLKNMTIKTWNIDKNNHKLIINFKPRNSRQNSVSLSWKKILIIRKNSFILTKDNNWLIKSVFDNILTDVYHWYQVLALILIPPFL